MKKLDSQQQDLVSRYVKFARKRARAYAKKVHHNFEDLYNAALEGLCKAALTFDSTKSKFITHANVWMYRAMQREYNRFLTEACIAVPTHVIEARFARSKHPAWRRRHGTLKLADWEIDYAPMRWSGINLYGDEEPCCAWTNGLLKTFDPDKFVAEDDPRFEAIDRNDTLRKAFMLLTPEEQSVIKLKYGLGGEAPMLFREIGEIKNVTKQRVDQIHKNALSKLRQIIEALEEEDENCN